MRQERITRKARRRTSRQPEATPEALPQTAGDVAAADEVLAHIAELMSDLQEAA